MEIKKNLVLQDFFLAHLSIPMGFAPGVHMLSYQLHCIRFTLTDDSLPFNSLWGADSRHVCGDGRIDEWSLLSLYNTRGKYFFLMLMLFFTETKISRSFGKLDIVAT